ncbi:MAG TPA: Ni/Fe hydrogenase subunit gamma [Planctomycetaceae bacterium]|jgi:NAD(P)H-flavin reductase|nr:Ni/Fe hydrogenase subunit gamma [Planctomycetaceae bacterium]
MTVSNNPWVHDTVRIAAIRQELPDVWTYDLELTDPRRQAEYRFEPGQFNMLYLPGVGESAISISANPASRGPVAHTVRLAGNVTRTLGELEVGETLGLRGPFGSTWPLDAAAGRDVVLVAGGIGLAPLRPAIYELLARRGEVRSLTLLVGARSPDLLLFAGELEDWRHRGIHVEVTVDRVAEGWTGQVGVVTLLLARLPLPHPAETLLLTCGPEVMMRYTVQTALQRGIPAENLWVSTERNMQCAIGLCGHCQLGPVFICREGPVFAWPRIAPWLFVEGL